MKDKVTIAALREALVRDGYAQVSDFGSFRVENRAEFTTVNPVTQKKMKVPAQRVITFRPSKKLKQDINGK